MINGVLLPAAATVLANACGPCIGQWQRTDSAAKKANTIITTFNRNFRGRNDGNRETLSFIASPEIVMALGLAGRLDFNPLTDSFDTPKGKIRLAPPSADELPANGFAHSTSARPEVARAKGEIIIRADSDRLQLLQPFRPRNEDEFSGNLILAKLQGKCTTDHISPAGTWLRYRGHLQNISRNMLAGASNAFSGAIGKGKNLLNHESDVEFATIALAYQQARKGWVIIGDENYGEGSSRELAAMSPRYLGGTAVIARSFARIHESNLKKQGVLALTFVNPTDYDKIREDDVVSIKDVNKLASGRTLALTLEHADGTMESLPLKHSYSAEQIRWFWAGSALNAQKTQRSK